MIVCVSSELSKISITQWLFASFMGRQDEYGTQRLVGESWLQQIVRIHHIIVSFLQFPKLQNHLEWCVVHC